MRTRPWLWLLASILAWIPLILPMSGADLGIPFWPSQVVLALLTVAIFRTTADDLARRKVPTLVQCALRSIGGAVAFGIGTEIHLLCGGGWLGVDGRLFLVSGTFFGALTGPLAIFEHHAAIRPASRRADLVAALLSGWSTFLLLCAGWINGYYVIEILKGSGVPGTFAAVERGALWLTESPWWTFVHFAWAGVPVGAFVYSRLRGWPVLAQQAFGLSLAGAVHVLFPSSVWAISFGLIFTPLALPLLARVADLRKRPETEGEGVEEDSRALAFLRKAAIAASLLSIAGMAVREAYRAHARSTLGLKVEVETSGWEKALRVSPGPTGTDAFASETADLAAIQSQVVALVRSPSGADARPVLEDLAVLDARLASIVTRLQDERARAAAALSEIASLREQVRQNGGGLELISHLNVLTGNLTGQQGTRGTLLFQISDISAEIARARERRSAPGQPR